jgi:protein TonB
MDLALDGPQPSSLLTSRRRWHGPGAAVAIHLGAALVWLAVPAPPPPLPAEQVVEMVLVPPPPAPVPEVPASAAPHPAPPKPAAAIKRPPTPATIPTPRTAPVPASMAAPVGESAPQPAPAPNPVAAPAPPPSEPDLQPSPSEAPRPAYPLAARKRGVQGVVTLLVTVADNGAPVEIALKSSSGHAILDDAALDAVRRWRFHPARHGGRAVAAILELPVRFTLEASG